LLPNVQIYNANLALIIACHKRAFLSYLKVLPLVCCAMPLNFAQSALSFVDYFNPIFPNTHEYQVLVALDTSNTALAYNACF
jgi:hypothetical protein